MKSLYYIALSKKGAPVYVLFADEIERRRYAPPPDIDAHILREGTVHIDYARRTVSGSIAMQLSNDELLDQDLTNLQNLLF